MRRAIRKRRRNNKSNKHLPNKKGRPAESTSYCGSFPGILVVAFLVGLLGDLGDLDRVAVNSAFDRHLHTRLGLCLLQQFFSALVAGLVEFVKLRVRGVHNVSACSAVSAPGRTRLNASSLSRPKSPLSRDCPSRP